MSNPNPLVSVVIPLYKTNLTFFRACLDAITNQTYAPLEIIIVDDGNENNYLKAVKKMMERKKIVLIQQANRGAGAARNKALKKLKGELVTFVDADDIPAPNYCEALVKALLSTQSDLTIFQYSNTIDASPPPNKLTSNFTKKMLQGELPMGIYAKIFRTSFLNDHAIRFPEQVLSEERHFLIQCFQHAKTIHYVPQSIYIRRQHPASTMHSITAEDVAGLTRLCKMDLAFLRKQGASQTILFHCYLAHYRVLKYCYYKFADLKSWEVFLVKIALSNIWLKIAVLVLYKVFLFEVRFRFKKLFLSSLIHKLVCF